MHCFLLNPEEVWVMALIPPSTTLGDDDDAAPLLLDQVHGVREHLYYTLLYSTLLYYSIV